MAQVSGPHFRDRHVCDLEEMGERSGMKETAKSEPGEATLEACGGAGFHLVWLGDSLEIPYARA